MAALASLLALARSRSSAAMPSVLNKLNSISIADRPTSFKRTALYVYELCLSDLSELDTRSVATAAARLELLYPDRSYQVNRRLSDLLVLLDVASVG